MFQSLIERLKLQFQSIFHIPFLLGLTLLLLNDFYFKAEFHNWFTGKLSDFSGLFVFVLFFQGLFPNKKLNVYLITGLGFIFWKSNYSQGFIEWFSQTFYVIHRVVDYTDLLALLVLPVAYFYKPNDRLRLKLNPYPILCVALFSFCATSYYGPVLKFKRNQYVLFNHKAEDVMSAGCHGSQVYHIDNHVLVEVKEILLPREDYITDDYFTVQHLKTLDLYALKSASKEFYNERYPLTKFIEQRDSLLPEGVHTIILKRDGYTDSLNFYQSRLHGEYKRIADNGELVIGNYFHGLEDSIWIYYNADGLKKMEETFVKGEVVESRFFFPSDKVVNHKIRKEGVKEKQIVVGLLGVFLLVLVLQLVLTFNKQRQNSVLKIPFFLKIVGCILLPLVCLALANLGLFLIPEYASTYTPPGFLGEIFQIVLAYVFGIPLFLILFFGIKVKNKMDILYYVLFFSLVILFVYQWNDLSLLLIGFEE